MILISVLQVVWIVLEDVSAAGKSEGLDWCKGSSRSTSDTKTAMFSLAIARN